MIKTFKHKGIKLFFEKGNCSGIQVKHKKRLRMQLSALDTAHVIEDVNLPGYNLHKLKGDRKNCWSITVSGNWRLTFEFFGGNAYIVTTRIITNGNAIQSASSGGVYKRNLY
jgi:proteic killer suppression protein